ncbi:MAG TPA: MFS transporter [Streptosporangiaceae bacterium]|nr:MFS transporter [Streptosporangiaceae bacterium]
MTSTASRVPSRGIPADRARYRDVLGIGEFRVIFVANIVSMLGNVVAAVALTVLIYEQTHSPALAASVMALAFLPYLLGGVLLGSAPDRLPARRVLVVCDLLSTTLVAAMVIPGLPVAALLVLLFANGLISPVYQGTRAAVLPDVLPPGPGYVLGRSMMRMVAQSAQIVGYGAGGLLLTIMPPRGALAFDAASFAASAVLLRSGMRRRPARSAAAGSMAGDSLAGIRGVLAHRQVRRILLFSWLVPACAVTPEALAAPYASHIGQPARVAGFLLMGIPAGTVAADVIVARLLPGRLQRRLIVPAGLLVFAPLAVFAASPRLVPALGLLVISGLGAAWVAGLDGLLIAAAPPGLRGRALALESAGLMFIQGVGFALWGIAGQYVPLVAVIPAAAVIGILVVVTLRPRLQQPCAGLSPGAQPAHSPAAD